MSYSTSFSRNCKKLFSIHFSTYLYILLLYIFLTVDDFAPLRKERDIFEKNGTVESLAESPKKKKEKTQKKKVEPKPKKQATIKTPPDNGRKRKVDFFCSSDD